MCEANPGLFPVQALAFAPLRLRRVGLPDRHPPAIHLGHHHRAASLLGPCLPRRGRLEDASGVPLGDAAEGALAQQHPVVFDQFVHRPAEGHIGGKVRDYPLQRARCAPVVNLGAACERTQSLGSTTKLRFFHAYFAKGAVPAGFFLPSCHAPPACLASWAVLSTCPCAHPDRDSRPIRRISSRMRCSAASASRNSPISSSTARSKEVMPSLSVGLALSFSSKSASLRCFAVRLASFVLSRIPS